MPQSIALSQNYPNPFNPATRIEYSLPEEDRVRLEIYNILGQRVRTLVDEKHDTGEKSVTWDGADESGQPVASGTYFYELRVGDEVKAKKMLLLK